MDKQYVEDFKKGEIFHLGEHFFSEDEIVDFAKNMILFLFTLIKMRLKKLCLVA